MNEVPKKEKEQERHRRELEIIDHIHFLPDIKKLPSDPEWDAIEQKIVAHISKQVIPFEG